MCRPLRLAGRLALTTALGTLALGYGRRAYAGSCIPAGSIILCSGPADAATDVSQFLYGSVIQTAPGFGLDTSLNPGATALNLNGDGGLSLDASAAGLSIFANATGIRAYNFNGGAISVDTRGGAVTAGTFADQYATFSAIRAVNQADGTGMTIRTADISATYIGILGRNSGAGAFVIDTTAGDMLARDLGISVENSGTDLLIATGQIKSFTKAAIWAQNNGTGRTDIDTRSGAIMGGSGESNGSGGSGGNGDDGIRVRQAASAGAVSVTSADVSAKKNAIWVSSASGAPVQIDSRSGKVVSSSSNGILAFARDIDIRSAYVKGGIEGIAANNRAGGLSIDSTAGSVTGNGQSGIDAFNYGADALVTTADVTGATNGITLDNKGTGDAIIDSSRGAVSGGLNGIFARNAGQSMAITTKDVTGGAIGIYAVNQSGQVAIDSTAGEVSGGILHGIYVRETGSGASIRTANVKGDGVDGIQLVNNGTGATSIDTRGGSLTGAAAGLRVVQSATAGAVGITTARVAGGADGIRVLSQNAAGVTIDSRNGAVSGTSAAGIGIDASNVNILTADVQGGKGLDILNRGGAVTIDSTGGAVTGSSGFGIDVLSYGSDVSLASGTVSGQGAGIKVVNKGTGAVIVDATGGKVSGGLSATNYGTSLAIAAGRTGGFGIDAVNKGAGDLTITSSSGDVNDGDGLATIKALNYGRDTRVTLAGTFFKVDTDHRGSGLALVDTTNASLGPDLSDLVSPSSDVAIRLSASSGSARIVTGDVHFESTNPQLPAIMLESTGDGSAEIDTRAGSVAAKAPRDDEIISAIKANTTHGITVRTAAVQALATSGQLQPPPGNWAIKALNIGTGDVVIDTTGGSLVGAIQAGSSGGAGNVAITTAAVTANNLFVAAVEASKAGAGDIIIDSSRGTLTSLVSRGVYATTDGSSGDLRITTADVTAYSNGITAIHGGAGALRIDTSAGALASTYKNATGIVAFNHGTDLDITAGDVSGRLYGMYVRNFGSGVLAITGAGTISGRDAAVLGYNYGAGLRVSLAGQVNGLAQFMHQGTGDANLDFRAATVTSSDNGVVLQSKTGDAVITLGSIVSESTNRYTAAAAFFHEGSGQLVIDARAGTLTSRSAEGLYARSAGAGSIAIQTGSISAARRGIMARNFGGGSITIDSSAGQVTSTNGAGIYTRNDAVSADMRIRSGSITAGPSAFAISAGNLGTGSTRIEVAQDAVVAGGAGAVSVRHAGSDSFSIDNAGTLRRLSDDPTALVIDAKSEGAAGGLTLANTGRITGTVSLTEKDDRFVNDGTWNMPGGTSDFGAGNDVFENRSNLTVIAAADPARAETTTLHNLEAFRNSGTVTLRDGAVGDVLTASGDFDGSGGTIHLDMTADGTAADLFRIMGSVTGGPSLLTISYQGAAGVIGAGSAPLIEVAGQTKDGDFRIANPVWDGLVYRLVLREGHTWSATPAFALAETFAALDRDAGVTERMLDGQQAGIVNALAQDCARFGATGACLSLAGRSTTLSEDTGPSDALVLTAAVQPAETRWRMGAFLDQRVAGALPDGFSFDSMGPTLGGFAGYGAAGGLGPRLRLSGAWTTARLGITRAALPGLIEGGAAEAGFSGWGVGSEVGYGFGLGGAAALTPFIGLRRVVSTRGAYAEQAGDAAYPLSADAMALSQTTLSSGLKLETGHDEEVSLQAGFGFEHDLIFTRDSFTGHLQDIGAFSAAAGESWQRTRLFGGAGLDFALQQGFGLSLSAAARQLPRAGVVDVTASAGIRASF